MALACYERLFNLPEAFVDQGFAEEYMSLLNKEKKYEKSWEFFQTIPAQLQAKDRLSLTAGIAAVETEHYDYVESLFDRTFAVIREGENSTSDLWFRWKARMLAKERGVAYSEELMTEVQLEYMPPENLDFRMFAAIDKKKLKEEAKK